MLPSKMSFCIFDQLQGLHIYVLGIFVHIMFLFKTLLTQLSWVPNHILPTPLTPYICFLYKVYYQIFSIFLLNNLKTGFHECFPILLCFSLVGSMDILQYHFVFFNGFPLYYYINVVIIYMYNKSEFTLCFFYLAFSLGN